MQRGNFKDLFDYGFKNPLYPHAISSNVSNREVKKMPTKKVTKAIDIPTGDYVGTIEKNEIKDSSGYEYHETFIKTEIEGNPVLRLGVPFVISTGSALGKIVERFGAELKEDSDINTDDFLKVGMKVSFSVVKKEGKGKSQGVMFSNIVADSLKPKKE